MKTLLLILTLAGSLLAGNYHNPQPSPIPEPSTWLMIAGGLGALIFAARRKK